MRAWPSGDWPYPRNTWRSGSNSRRAALLCGKGCGKRRGMSQSGHSTPRNYTAEGLKNAKPQYNARNESGTGAKLVHRGRGVFVRAGADLQHRTKPAHAGGFWRHEPGAAAGDGHGVVFAADFPRRRARAAVLGAHVIRSTSLVRATDVVRAVRSLREYPHA